MQIAFVIWRTKRWDVIPWLATFLTVLFDSVEVGILVGLFVSFLPIVYHNLRPRAEVLGQKLGTNQFEPLFVSLPCSLPCFLCLFLSFSPSHIQLCVQIVSFSRSLTVQESRVNLARPPHIWTDVVRTALHESWKDLQQLYRPSYGVWDDVNHPSHTLFLVLIVSVLSSVRFVPRFHFWTLST